MNKTLIIKRPLIWIKRFRNRCGYGVHSPSAFDFITNVIYEKSPYYAYNEIENSDVYKKLKEDENSRPFKKVNRLLFRIVNRCQPQSIIEIGHVSTSSLYLKAAKRNIKYFSYSDEEFINKIIPTDIDLLYIHYTPKTENIKNIIAQSLPVAHRNSIIIIEGIYQNSSIKQLWNDIANNENITTTYDLYYLGIIFLDSRKIKQNYKVNF